MEKGYKNLVYFFGIIALITFVGFYKKYFSLAPDFPGLKDIHHFHAILLTSWLALLMVQPVLIARNQINLHRTLGKVSYGLAPIAFISMLLAYHHQYLRFMGEGQPESFTLSFIFSPMTDAVPFIVLFGLGILNRRDTPRHMRYMISTGVIIGGPGLGRIFMTWFGMEIFVALQLVVLSTLVAFISLLIYDRFKKKTFPISPFTISFIIWLAPNILIIFFPETALWQTFAKWLVTTL